MVNNHILTTEHLKLIVKHNNDTFATKTAMNEAIDKIDQCKCEEATTDEVDNILIGNS